MAAYLGISPQYFSDIKRGSKSLSKKTVMRIHENRGLPPEDFRLLLFSTGEEFVRLVQKLMSRSANE